MGVPEAAGFIEILESKNPDYSKLPKSNKIFQDIYDQKVVYNRKEVSRVADELRNKISDLESRKTAADQVLKEGRSEKLLQKLTEKKYEKDMLEKNMSSLKSRMSDLNHAATEYKRLKLAQTRLIWSSQRRYRLDYSDRIAKFTDQEMNTNLEILKNTNDPQNTADINRIYEEYHKIDPNAMVQSNGEPKPKDDRTIVVQVSGRISFDKIDNIN